MGDPVTDGPAADIVSEARRLMDLATESNVTVRLLGGLAVHEHVPGSHPTLSREYKDIDLITTKRESSRVEELLTAGGYEPDREFNALNAHRRLLFYDTAHGRQLDVFVGDFEMCHKLPLADRLDAHPTAVPLAELLLTKFQVAELNRKDELDIAAVLLAHDIAEHDQQAVNGARMAELCASDWGLWRTTRMNIERMHDHLGELVSDPGERQLIDERLQRVWERIEREPKSRGWKLRNRVGDKMRWYEQPEEVG